MSYSTGSFSPITAGGGSTSTVSAEASTGWHVFKVEGYSQYKATGGIATAVSSGEFIVGGHSWRIQFFPACRCTCTGKQNPGWICFGLHRNDGLAAADDGGAVAKALFELSLLGVDDDEPLRSYRRSWEFSYKRSRAAVAYHFGSFIRTDAFDSLYLKADCFRIRCDHTVFHEARDEPVLPSPDLHRHLGDILATGVGGDVTFELGMETFVAHRIVLASRSPVFMAEFFGGGSGMMEEKAGMARVRILGIHARAFKAMLHFIYTDSLPEIDGDEKIVMAQHLLVAADRYDLQRLKLICENKLCLYVNASIVATTLVLAEKHGCGRRLKEACFKVLKHGDNFKALGCDDYNYLVRCCPALLTELRTEHGLESMPSVIKKKN